LTPTAKRTRSDRPGAAFLIEGRLFPIWFICGLAAWWWPGTSVPGSAG
jgi:hypothetical protein